MIIDEIYNKRKSMFCLYNKYPNNLYLGHSQYRELMREIKITASYTIHSSVDKRAEIFNMKIYEVDDSDHMEVL